jgi:hypothetical protein
MSRTGITPRARDLAQRLISFEVAAESLSKVKAPAAFVVSEKLRHPLSTLVGTAGFRSLLMRSLTLAKREAPILNGVRVKDDGSLEGLTGEAMEAGEVLIAHFIGLLETFIGEALTLHLLQGVWPDPAVFDITPERKQSI